ncbi:hypothetical protein ABE502_03235 [Stenotrophomonas sepilia]|uniref:hypothetical protein n=1 Tax=Stenotrophomonas sepilia TaxID=2860290 RepID=UPI003207D4D8
MASSKGLVWKVALGVFLGVTACGLATCGVVGILGLGYMKDRADATNETLNIINDGRGAEPLNFTVRAEEMRRAQQEARMQPQPMDRQQHVPLKDDERCVGGTRLKRVENGWEQSGSCP